MRFRGRVEGMAVLLAACVLACLLTYPYVLRFDRAGRLDTNDGRWSIWVVSWVAHALTTDPLNVYRANIFHPHQNALTFSEGNLVEGAMGVPVWLLTKNPYATHNSVALLSFVLSSLGGYYLVRYLTADRGAAAVAALLFAYCPFVFARTAHIQLLVIGGLPWCMLAFHRLIDRTTIGRAAALGVALWLTGLSCAYYGIFAGGMVAVGTIMMAITRGRWREPGYWMAIAAAAAVCIGLTFPLFLPYLDLQRESGFARSLSDAGSYSANAGAWLASAAWAHRWWLPAINALPPWPMTNPGFSEVLFPGIVTTILGVWGAWLGLRGRDPVVRLKADTTLASGSGQMASGQMWRPPLGGPPPTRLTRDVVWLYVTIAVVAFWTTLGPKAGLYTVLHYTIPVFSFLRAPSRTGIVVTLCLVVLSSIAITRILRASSRPGLMTAILFGVAIADLIQIPLGMRDARSLPHAFETLALLPRGPVIELPYWYTRPEFPRHAEYMVPSTAHWQPLINGYSDHIPQDFRDAVRPLSTFPSPESFAILEKLGARYAVFHMNMFDAVSKENLISRLQGEYATYLRPLELEGEVWLYEIIAWPR